MMHTHTHTQKNTNIHTYIHRCTNMTHTHIHTYKYTHKYKHTYMHTPQLFGMPVGQPQTLDIIVPQLVRPRTHTNTYIHTYTAVFRHAPWSASDSRHHSPATRPPVAVQRNADRGDHTPTPARNKQDRIHRLRKPQQHKQQSCIIKFVVTRRITKKYAIYVCNTQKQYTLAATRPNSSRRGACRY